MEILNNMIFYIFERFGHVQHTKRLLFLYICRLLGIKTIQKKIKRGLPKHILKPK